MRWFRLVTAVWLVGAVLGFDTQGYMARKAMADEHRARVAEEIRQEQAAITEPTKARFLNDKTKPYAVDGSGLPLVDWDIGESYAGQMNIGDTSRKLFFWFFPTSNPQGQKDIVIWLQGGPGSSSLIGLLEENGPFVWRPGTARFRKNIRSWHLLANIVYIEQPVGMGFTVGTPNIKNEFELAEQFNAFWKNFVDTFSLQNYNIYVTGESYAGMYVPYIADDMLNRTDTATYNVKGILLYDPIVGSDVYFEAAIVPYCQYNSGSLSFPPYGWKQLISKYESCGWKKFVEEKAYVFPPKGPIHFKPPKGCDVSGDAYGQIALANHCFDYYQISNTCPYAFNPLFGLGPAKVPGLRTTYFDREDVKRAINAPTSMKWNAFGSAFKGYYDLTPYPSGPNGPLVRIAEKTNNVFYGHSTSGLILQANATLFALNNMVWNGARGFDKPPETPVWIPQRYVASKPGHYPYRYQGSWTKSRGITFTYVTTAGHQVPGFAASAAFRHMEVLLGRVSSLSDKVKFTVQGAADDD